MTKNESDMSWYFTSAELQLCCCNDCQREAERRIGQGSIGTKEPRSIFGGRLDDNFFVIVYDAYAKKGSQDTFLKSEQEMSDEEQALCFAAKQLSSARDYDCWN